ncbi:hypothetical protein ALC53_00867 [Atta colombica]|uniref:Uncharacterized protein n=1 Tax=Atta colombica TaxID=520822 RepID=A0A195BV03_9HYME|nr:hypothetical protein ALC53_00867 [Atta colombica]
MKFSIRRPYFIAECGTRTRSVIRYDVKCFEAFMYSASGPHQLSHIDGKTSPPVLNRVFSKEVQRGSDVETREFRRALKSTREESHAIPLDREITRKFRCA